MPNRKQKIKLSQKLSQGINTSSTQSLFFRLGGTFFLLLSLIMATNIYKNVSAADGSVKEAYVQPQEQQVLGAFDDKRQAQKSPVKEAPKEITYTVEKGDTLFNIAQKKNLNWVVIATLNDLKAPYELKPGTVLTLPANQ
jgi:LysM repeat protein